MATERAYKLDELPQGRTDWDRLYRMTDEDIEMNAALDEDNPILDLPTDRVGLDQHIDRLLAKLAEREAEIATNDAIAKRRIDDIEAWRRQQNETHEREAQWIRQQVAAIAKRYDFGKRKSRDLPSGTFGHRWRPETIEIVDEAAAVAFAEANGLEIKKSVNKTPLVSHLKETDIVPDGCKIVPGEDSFFVTVGGGK